MRFPNNTRLDGHFGEGLHWFGLSAKLTVKRGTLPPTRAETGLRPSGLVGKDVGMGVIIELYIRTRGCMGDACCTKAMGPQGDTRTPLCTRVEYETHVGVCVY